MEAVSDLTNASGTSVTSMIYFCMEEGRKTNEEYWPYQPRPGPYHREKWQQFLNTLCKTPTLHLKVPLGMWLRSPPKCWEAYYDPMLGIVLILHNHKWQHYGHYIRERRHWRVPQSQPSIDHTPPDQLQDLQPVDIIRTTVTHFTITIPIPCQSPPPPSTQYIILATIFVHTFTMGTTNSTRCDA